MENITATSLKMIAIFVAALVTTLIIVGILYLIAMALDWFTTWLSRQ